MSFFDSAGVSTVVETHQRAHTVGTELRIVCDCRAVRRTLTITTVDRYLNLYRDRDTAIEEPVPSPLSSN